MFAALYPNQNIKIIRKFQNVKAPTGVVFSDIRYINKETLVENDIYQYIPGQAKPNKYSRIISQQYVVDAVEGTITEEIEWSLDPLSEIKEKLLKEIQEEEISRLETTNWMVIRKVETSQEIEPEWEQYRADIRLAAEQGKDFVEKAKKNTEICNYSVTWPDLPNLERNL